MVIDSVHHRIWVLGTVGGIDVIDYITGNVQERYLMPSVSSDKWCVTFKKFGSELWIGTTKGLVAFDMEKKRFSSIDLGFKEGDKSFHRINIIEQDKYGNVWVFTNEDGLYIINNVTKRIVFKKVRNEFTFRNPTFEFTSATFISDTVLIGTTAGLRCYKFNSTYQFAIVHLPKSIDSITENSSIRNIFFCYGELFICCRDFIVCNTTFKKFNILSHTCNDPWLKEINSIFCLPENLIILGCSSGLAIFNNMPTAVAGVSNSKMQFSNKLKHLFALYPVDDQAVLCATESGLYNVNENGIEKTLDSVNMYQNISPLQNNELIVSNKAGSFVYKKGRLIPIASLYPEFLYYKDWQINSCKSLNDSLYVLGTENYKGILVWNKKAKSVQNITATSNPVLLKSDNVNTVFVDSYSRIWVLSDFSISVIDYFNKKARYLMLPNNNTIAPAGFYFDMVQVGNEFWIATYEKGIILLDKDLKLKKIICQNDGLCNNGVYKIFNSGMSVFISSNNGISQINTVNGKIKNIFYPFDGLHGNSFEEACGAIKNDKIYFGGLDGFTCISPKIITLNTIPPKLYFQDIHIETAANKYDTLNTLIKDLSIPNDFIQMRISFAGINYRNLNRVQYWYRIKESQEQWSSLGSQNFVSLIKTRPGTYTLEVKAANEDGIECMPITVTLVFLPKWYETIWLKIGIVLAIAAIFYALYRYRLSQLKAREAIRRKIASDLHDDLGSTLTSIRIFTDLAIRQNPKDFLLQIKQGIQDAMTATRDMIWIMDRTRNNAAQLAEKINSFILPLTKANNLDFEFQAGKDLEDVLLKADEQRDLYLIVKEFITNSLKYAGCKKISVRMDKHGKRIAVTIYDNGKGFDINTIKRGKGITNMLARAAAIRYRVTLNSSVNGTMLQLIPWRKRFWVA